MRLLLESLENNMVPIIICSLFLVPACGAGLAYGADLVVKERAATREHELKRLELEKKPCQ